MRGEAARLLSQLRCALQAGCDAETLDSQIDWLHLIMPDRPVAQRLKIERLLDQGHTDEACTLTARALLQRPDQPAITMLRARALFDHGRLESAAQEIQRALILRPHHTGTLLLASKIATARSEHDKAIALLRSAIHRSPEHIELHWRLASLLLERHDPRAALDVLEQFEDPPVLLLARALDAVNRTRESIDILEVELRSLHRCEPHEYRDALLAQLIEIQEPVSDRDTLLATIARCTRHTPQAQIAAASAIMRLGMFKEALATAVRIMRDPHAPGLARHHAMHTACVAASLGGRSRLAQRLVHRLRSHRLGIDARIMAGAWRCGLIGRVLSMQRLDQTAQRAASRKGHSSRDHGHLHVLHPLLHHARSVFHRQIMASSKPNAAAAAANSTHEHARLHRNIALCEAALGRSDRALTALSQSLAPLQGETETGASDKVTLPIRRAA